MKIGLRQAGKSAFNAIHLLVLLSFLVTLLPFLAQLASAEKFLEISRVNPEQFKDFRLDYIFGQLAVSPERERIYDADVQNQWLQQLTAPARLPYVDYLPYPPFFCLLTIPLTWLPINVSYLLFCLGGLAAGITGTVVVYRTFGKKSGKLIFFILLGGLVCLPSRQCIQLGQTSWLFAGLIAIYFSSMLAKRDIASGISLCLLAIKPPLAIFMAMAALAHRRWKILSAFGVSIALSLIISATILGGQTVAHYPTVLLKVASTDVFDESFRPEGMIGIQALLSQVLPRQAAKKLAGLAAAATLLPLFLLWKKTQLHSDQQMTWAIAITILTYLLAAPHVNIYDCLLLTIPAALSLPTVSLPDTGDIRPRRLQLWTIIFILFPALSCFAYLAVAEASGHRAYNFTFLVINALLLALAVRLYLSEKKTDSPPSNAQPPTGTLV